MNSSSPKRLIPQATTLPTPLTVDGEGFFIYPPSVGLAVQILYVLEHREIDFDLSTSTGDDELLKHLLGQWLPPSVVGAVSEMLLTAQVDLILRLLFGSAFREKEGEKKAVTVDWTERVTHYAYTFRVDPNQVWEQTRFDVFLSAFAYIERERALEKIQMWDMYAISQMTGEAVKDKFETWYEIAGIEITPVQEQDVMQIQADRWAKKRERLAALGFEDEFRERVPEHLNNDENGN